MGVAGVATLAAAAALAGVARWDREVVAEPELLAGAVEATIDAP
jgi:hypothetical protein